MEMQISFLLSVEMQEHRSKVMILTLGHSCTSMRFHTLEFCVLVLVYFMQIVPQRKEHSDSVREAVELAVMSTVSHPNMLGIQVCVCVLWDFQLCILLKLLFKGASNSSLLVQS